MERRLPRTRNRYNFHMPRAWSILRLRGFEENRFQGTFAFQVRIAGAGLLQGSVKQSLAVVYDQEVGAEVLDQREQMGTDDHGRAAAACARMEFFSVRMPRGSSPVNGSSKRIADGRCR